MRRHPPAFVLFFAGAFEIVGGVIFTGLLSAEIPEPHPPWGFLVCAVPFVIAAGLIAWGIRVDYPDEPPCPIHREPPATPAPPPPRRRLRQVTSLRPGMYEYDGEIILVRPQGPPPDVRG